MKSFHRAVRTAGRQAGRSACAALAGVVIALFLGACANDSGAAAPSPAAVEHAATAIPAEPRLADLYRQSCRACHATPGSGAPLTGDRHAWEKRWDKGPEALRSSTISGLNGMPAGGQCFACTPQDYDALIRFMAGKEVISE